MPIQRVKTRPMQIGTVTIGGDNPIAVQSMTNTDTSDAAATATQANALAAAGCDIVRCAVPDMAAVRALYDIRQRVSIPVVADIHFDYKLALEAAAAGADKIRINPGNIGGEDRVQAVAAACTARGIPIRIGINGGSLEKPLLQKYGGVTAEAMVESAFGHIRLLNRFDFDNICVSLKCSDVPTTIAACRLLSEHADYPQHIGVTEAGTEYMGTVKSAAGIGGLLAMGIGDTIRVTLTADPLAEIPAAYAILKAVGLHRSGVNIISCPTCGRTKIDLIPIAMELERRLAGVKKRITVAVMGCAVNGPGEAREADIGVAGGSGEAVLFKKGESLGKVPQDRIVEVLLAEIEKMPD